MNLIHSHLCVIEVNVENKYARTTFPFINDNNLFKFIYFLNIILVL